MQGMVAATLYKHQVTHVIIMLLLLNLLSARRATVEVVLLLFLMRVLMTVLLPGFVTLFVILRLSVVMAVLKSKHLRRFLIIKHVFMVFKLMRHLSVHFGCVLIWMLNMMIFALVLIINVSCSVAKSVSSSMGTLHSV